MFTGLVTATAAVLGVESRDSGIRLTVERPAAYRDAVVGESIAVSGVCLTAVPSGPDQLAFDVSPESLQRSTLGSARAGRRVNLERALRVGDRLGGHIVAGHVDATTALVRIESTGAFRTLAFALDPLFSRYVVEKGSIALDGVSLTVAHLGPLELDVAVIPETLAATTFGAAREGDLVNVEVDVLGKYVERILGADTEAGRDERLRRLLEK